MKFVIEFWSSKRERELKLVEPIGASVECRRRLKSHKFAAGLRNEQLIRDFLQPYFSIFIFMQPFNKLSAFKLTISKADPVSKIVWHFMSDQEELKVNGNRSDFTVYLG